MGDGDRADPGSASVHPASSPLWEAAGSSAGASRLQQPHLSSAGDCGSGSHEVILRNIKQPFAKGPFLPFNVLRDLPWDLGALRAFTLKACLSSDLHSVKCHQLHLSAR